MKLALEDKFFVGLIYIVLSALGFTAIYPFWNAAVISFNSGTDTMLGGITFWPRQFTLQNYEVVFKDKRLVDAFVISVLRTAAGTVSSIAATAIFAYGMTKRGLIGRRLYMIMCVVTMYFGGGLIPSYLLIQQLNLMDSFWVMVIPGIISVWNMIIFRTFFNGIPQGLEESAQIDGSSNWGIFFRIVLPLSGPVIATLALFTAVYHWNDWFTPSIYITNSDLLPIQTKLNQILNSNIMLEQMQNMDSAAQGRLNQMRAVTSKSLSMATMMVATVPILCIYPFVQKYFVKGVLIGSLKE